MPRPIALDLFAGAGGMSLGFEQAGFDVIGAIEIDPIHAAIHAFNFPQTDVICQNIITINETELMERLDIGVGDLDVIFGGPPCQGFSLIGKRIIDDPRNALLGHFARIINGLQPKYFVMENVAGLTVGDSRHLLETLIEEFREFGYHVVLPYKVLNSANFGVPQNRKRLFLLGYRDDMPMPSYPHPTHRIRGNSGTDGGERGNENLSWCPSVEDAIGDLPNIDDFEDLMDTDEVEYRLHPQSQYARYLHGLDQDPENYGYIRIWDQGMLTSSLRTVHTEVSVERFTQTAGGTTEPVSRFFRLHPEGISNTLRAGTDSARGAYTSPRPIHSVYPRCISVREAARIHSFPDWFRFHATKWHGFREIGNSVPPLLVRAVASKIMDALGADRELPDEPMELGDRRFLTLDMTAAAAEFNVPRNVIATRNRNRREDLELAR
jgi:DNA (cytosine-5)-methyltransferase 1